MSEATTDRRAGTTGRPGERQLRLGLVGAVALVLVVFGGWLLVRDAGTTAGCDEVTLPTFRTIVVCGPDQRSDGPSDLTFELVGDPDAEASLGEFTGRYVVLNFWGAWCGPCREEQPALNAADEVLGDDVAFLGVAIQDSQVNQQAFREEFAVPYPSLFDQPNRLAAGFGAEAPRAPPTTFVLDREGRKATSIFGGLTTGELIAAVEAVQAADAAAATAAPTGD